MGLATPRAFAASNAAAALADVTQEKLDEATKDLTARGHDVLGVRCDVSNQDCTVAVGR